jgi:hypothetical protein
VQGRIVIFELGKNFRTAKEMKTLKQHLQETPLRDFMENWAIEAIKEWLQEHKYQKGEYEKFLLRAHKNAVIDELIEELEQ